MAGHTRGTLAGEAIGLYIEAGIEQVCPRCAGPAPLTPTEHGPRCRLCIAKIARDHQLQTEGRTVTGNGRGGRRYVPA